MHSLTQAQMLILFIPLSPGDLNSDSSVSLTHSTRDGSSLGKITHRTQSVEVIFPDSHFEHSSFHVLSDMTHNIILGHPWLEQHNPTLDWTSGQVLAWGPQCKDLCFKSQVKTVNDTHPDLSTVPE